MSEVGKDTKHLLKALKKNIIREKVDSAIVHEITDEKSFRNDLINLLTKRGSLQPKTAEELLDDYGIRSIKLAFTHPTMLESHSYELLETLGDSTVNKCMVWYITRRFPQLKKGESGNEIITELKKTYVNKASLSQRLNQLGLTKYIRYKELSYLEKDIEKKVIMDNSMREDVFEALMGAIEDLIDSKIMVNTGYSVVYNIITSLLDEDRHISINMEDILDPKTKILEIFGKRKSDTIFMAGEYVADKGGYIGKVIINFSGNPYYPGPSSPMTKEFISDAQKSKQVSEFEVAQQALDFMEKEYGVVWSRKSKSIL